MLLLQWIPWINRSKKKSSRKRSGNPICWNRLEPQSKIHWRVSVMIPPKFLTKFTSKDVLYHLVCNMRSINSPSMDSLTNILPLTKEVYSEELCPWMNCSAGPKIRSNNLFWPATRLCLVKMRWNASKYCRCWWATDQGLVHSTILKAFKHYWAVVSQKDKCVMKFMFKSAGSWTRILKSKQFRCFRLASYSHFPS